MPTKADFAASDHIRNRIERIADEAVRRRLHQLFNELLVGINRKK